jgi:hypothetical protein
MLDLTQSRIYESIATPLYNFSTTFEDGTGLIGKQVNGIMSATVNAVATNNDLFLGVAMSTLTLPTTAPVVVPITVPTSAPYTVVLTNTPNSGQIQVQYAATAGSFISETTTGAVTAAGEFNLTGSTLTFNAADAGAALIVTYNYNVSVIQAQALAGVGLIGGISPANITGTIGTVKRGLIFTSLFDASVNWNSTTSVVVGNNGIFTAGTNTGAAVNGYVASAPSQYSPFLGLWLRG